MRNKLLSYIGIALMIVPLMLSSCSKDPDEILPVDPVPIDLSADQVELISSENSFAFDIFKNILENAAQSENIIISPLSISVALSMTLNGADGSTLEAILETLRVNGISPETINNSYENLTEALLKVDKRVLISIANSIWTEDNFVVKKPFTDILTEYYNAQSKSFNVLDPGAPKQINDWIESNTNGLIKNMIDDLDPNTVMLLINAIYFKGKWNSQFDKDNTAQKPFSKSDGSASTVPMMNQTSDFKILQGEGFVFAEFPYGQGNFVMDVILPDENSGMNTLISELNEGSFTGWISQLSTIKTQLSFPKFKYGYKKELSEILTDMRMGIAFTDAADFSKISDIGIMISFVLHQAFIETNEEGTEAAAATVVGFGTTAAPTQPIIINLDHPFLYIIRETSTNSILFMGRVADPLAK